MGGLLARSCWNRNGANERESSTKGCKRALLAQTFGKPAVSTARHGARTLWGFWGRLLSMTWETCRRNKRQQKGLRSDWRLEANLNRKANGLRLEGPSVGLYVPSLEFNLICFPALCAAAIVEQPAKEEELAPGSTTYRSQNRRICRSVTTSPRFRRFLPFASILRLASGRSMHCNGA